MKLKTLFKSNKSLFGAVLSGILLTLAFAPFNIFPLGIIAPALLLYQWLDVTPKRAFLLGWLFGLGWFGTSVYWVFISIYRFGNASIAVSLIVTIGFISILALFPAFQGYLLARFFPKTNRSKLLYAFPLIWVFLEWIRSFIFTGFPWLLVGNSQINSPLKGFAPVLGVYGISLAVTVTSGLLLSTILHFRQHRKLVYRQLFSMLFTWVVASILCFQSWTTPLGQPIRVSLVQGNIAQSTKWNPDNILPTLDHYKNLSSAHWNARIVVWPEAAIPLPLQNATEFVNEMDEIATKRGAALITGIPVRNAARTGYFNTVITLGKGKGFYLKRRLVPFGEYVPFQQWFGRVFTFLDIPMSSFIAGPINQKPLVIDQVQIAPYICYEIAYPELVRFTSPNIGMILVVSNDAWFGESIAQAQHLAIARMRALELERPILFVANDGLTSIINAEGKIVKSAPAYQTFVLDAKVQPTQGLTPWQQWGMDPVLFSLIGLLITAIRLRSKEI